MLWIEKLPNTITDIPEMCRESKSALQPPIASHIQRNFTNVSLALFETSDSHFPHANDKRVKNKKSQQKFTKLFFYP